MAQESFFQLRQYRNPLTLKEYWASAAPSASTDKGPFAVGDLVWNTVPVNNGPICWICITAGADGSTAVFVPLNAGGNEAAYSADVHTAGFTLTAAQVSGGQATVDLALTGTFAGGANIQMPTVAALVAALPAAYAGMTYRLRIINAGTSQTMTVTTNTGWTLGGTMTIANNTTREFIVNLTSLTAATLTSVATGTYS